MVLKGRLTNSYVHMPKQESATGGPKNNKYPSMGSTGKLSHSSSKVNAKNNMLLKNSSSSQQIQQIRFNNASINQGIAKVSGSATQGGHLSSGQRKATSKVSNS